MAYSHTLAVAQAALNAIVDLIDVGSGAANGILRIYGGSVPADAETAISGQTLISEHDMTNPAFGAAADDDPGAIATAASIADAVAGASAVATFFRVLDRDENTILQGSCGESTEDMVFDNADINSGQTVSISAYTITLPET